jgi:hypothetical protein
VSTYLHNSAVFSSVFNGEIFTLVVFRYLEVSKITSYKLVERDRENSHVREWLRESKAALPSVLSYSMALTKAHSSDYASQKSVSDSF